MAKRLKLTLTKMQVQSLAVYAAGRVSSVIETEQSLWRAIEREAKSALAYNDRPKLESGSWPKKDAE